MEEYECLNCGLVHLLPERIVKSKNYICSCGCSEFRIIIAGKPYDQKKWKKKHEKESRLNCNSDLY